MTATPKDPDEITCPRCHSGPGVICRMPSGRKSPRIHAERRYAANPQARPKYPTTSPATAEGRSKGGKRSGEKRRSRRSTIADYVAQARADAILDAADNLAADAVRYDRERMALKAMTLEAARKAAARLIEALEGYWRVELDDDGKPKYENVEMTGKDGRPTVARILARRGSYSPDDLKALTVAARQTLEMLRLEEGSATSRQELVSGEIGAGLRDLADAPLADLTRRLADQLGRIEGAS